MKAFNLIGYPLGHSMSPFIHKELFKINGVNASYTLREISPERLEKEFDCLKNLCGFNVTIPHKTSIIPFLDKLSERAALFGAVNTVDNKNGVLTGYNTDCHGFLKALESAGIELQGRVLLCGSGGVSRMFAFESVMAGADLIMAVRTDDIPAAQRIKNEISEKLSKDIKIITLEDVDGEFDLLINGTPVGMHPRAEGCILPKEKIAKCRGVFDAVYNPMETKLIKYAREAGAKYSNGLPMLVWQAAVAQEIWLETNFDKDEVSRVIKLTEREMERL